MIVFRVLGLLLDHIIGLLFRSLSNHLNLINLFLLNNDPLLRKLDCTLFLVGPSRTYSSLNQFPMLVFVGVVMFMLLSLKKLASAFIKSLVWGELYVLKLYFRQL